MKNYIAILSFIVLIANKALPGTLTNFSYSAGSYLAGATTSYTISFTLATTVSGGGSDAILYVYFPDGFTVGGGGSASVTVNGVSQTITTYYQGLVYSAYIRIANDASAGSNVVIVLGVTNISTPGSYNFQFLYTADGGGHSIDAPASIDPFVISSTLPVELTSFTASVSNLTTLLVWKTATEVNNAGFDVERNSMNNHQSTINSWTEVGFVGGHGTTNAPHNYSFTDNVGTAGTYSYRLKQIDHNGAFTYSQEVQVQVDAAPKVFGLAQNYPNPFNPTTTMQFTVPNDGRASLKVYNTLGQEVATLFDGVTTAGEYHQATFDGSRFASGIYFARLQFGGQTLVKKLLMVK